MTPGPAKQFDRDAVLEEATKVFWHHGYEAAGMSLLLERMGIGRQSLYDTFGDKRGLYLEALDHYFRSRIAPVAALLRQPGRPLDNLFRAFEGLEQMVFSDGHVGDGCMFGNGLAEMSGDPEVASKLRRFLDSMEELFRETLEKAREAGELETPLSPTDLARLLVNTFHGLALLSKIDRNPGRAHGVMRAVRSLLRPS